MTLPRLFKMMYWSVRKDWRVCPHLLAVLAGCLFNLLVIHARRLTGRATLTIGLVEHLGDLVAAEPVSRLARRRFSAARIVWCVREPYAAVPAAFGAVDGVLRVKCLTEWLLLQAVGLGGPTWDLHINQRYCPRCQIPVLKIGQAGGINTDNYFSSGNLLAVQCLSAGLPVLTEGPVLPADQAAVGAVNRLNLPPAFIAIHCTSNDAIKDWPLDQWHDLLRGLPPQTELTVVEVGTRSRVIPHDEPGRRNLCGALSIAQTAEVLRRARLFIGIDSGPAHLANAVATPGVILLGRYKAFVDYMPFSGRYADGTGADLIRSDAGMTALPVAPVLLAVRQRLGLPAP